MVEIGDALADILYVTYGAGASFGIDLDKAYKLVHESNMSTIHIVILYALYFELVQQEQFCTFHRKMKMARCGNV